MDREALLYRRDERSFALLRDMDKIAREVVELPEGDPVRVEVERRLSEDLNQASDAVIQRIAELGKRIVEHTKSLEGLSGAQHIALEAYIHSLETMRIQYYDALANVIEGRKALGMQTEKLLQSLRPVIYLHAETLVGHIEFGAFALEDLKARLDGCSPECRPGCRHPGPCNPSADLPESPGKHSGRIGSPRSGGVGL